jgi:hypothetical protein
MIEAQKAKYVAAIKPAAILDNTSAAASVIDLADANYCEVILTLGATDIAMTALKLEECDTSGGSYTDVAGATFSGGLNTDGAALALPSATDDGQVCVFQVDTRGRKRYLKVVATFGDGSAGGFISGVARLSNLGYVPTVDTSLADGGVCRV